MKTKTVITGILGIIVIGAAATAVAIKSSKKAPSKVPSNETHEPSQEQLEALREKFNERY